MTRERSSYELSHRHQRNFRGRQTASEPQVMAFLHETDEDRLFVSVIVLGELRRGVALKADGGVIAESVP